MRAAGIIAHELGLIYLAHDCKHAKDMGRFIKKKKFMIPLLLRPQAMTPSAPTTIWSL
jgi:hypothetical protein